MGDPKMGVYPDPDGGARSNNYVPSSVPLSSGGIISGGIAVGAAATGFSTSLITNALAFLQGGSYNAPAEASRVMGVHGLTAPYVAVILVFGSLSVILQVINLVRGLRMRERLKTLSSKVCSLCETAGLISKT
jgi:hypothetical protein